MKLRVHFGLIPATLAWAVVAQSLYAGVLVTRSNEGYQFAEALSVNVNGKDKALSLGSEPSAASAEGKLSSVRLAGTLLKNGDNGAVALFEAGRPVYLLPEGLGKNEPKSPPAVWAAARITYRKSQAEKTPVDVPAASFVAFLPDGVRELAKLCGDDRAIGFIGGKEKAFTAQLELIAAAAKTYAADPEAAPLQKFVERAMRDRYERFESGVAGLEALGEGLKFAELSQTLYPKSPEHEKLRQDLASRKAWLDRKKAVLLAFAAVGEWDPFLLADRDFEKYQHAFPEMAKLHTSALKSSLEVHRSTGEAMLKESEYGVAFRQFQVALLRQPSDNLLRQRVGIAWTNYSRQLAVDRRPSRKQLDAGQRSEVARALVFASGYTKDNKLDLALKSVMEGEAIDPESLPVLLKKAEILGARREFNKALATLDEYDKRAVDEEREKGSALRSDLLFRQQSSVEDVKSKLQAAWNAGNYYQIRDLALQGLGAKDDDAELLYQIGVASMITRQPEVSRKYFTRYLDISNTLDANPEQRAKVRALLAGLGFAARQEDGDVSWFSGDKVPRGAYYSPVSLAFQPRIERIEASNKMHIAYEWLGDRLRSITPSWEKAEHQTGEKKIFFNYDTTAAQVNSVVYDDTSRVPQNAAALSPDELYKQSSVLLLNNPYIDPVAVQKLTGKNLALGISGNRYFHPFVWDRIHYFQLTYDSAGRVSQAREIASPGAAPGGDFLEFEWSGSQLQAVRGYQGKTRTYERTLDYADGLLRAEEIQAGGKSWKIKYNYNGGRLASATCDRDTSLDDRARQVFFK